MGMVFKTPWHVNCWVLRDAVNTGVKVWDLNEEREHKLVMGL